MWNRRVESEPDICLVKCTNSDNRYKYCIATGSEAVCDKLRNRVVPVFYLGASNGVFTLQPPGELVLKRLDKANNIKMHVSSEEKRLLQNIAPVEDRNGNGNNRMNLKRR